MERKLRKYLIFLSFLIVLVAFPLSCVVKSLDSEKAGAAKRSGLYEVEEPEEENSLSSLLSYIGTEEEESAESDLQRIRKRGKLVALTSYGPTSYFIYKGMPMGFEHDLLQHLAKELNVKLEIVVVQNKEEIIDKLTKGEGDIIADNLIITKETDERIDFTVPLMHTRQVLIQRKTHWDNDGDGNGGLLRSPSELIGRKVYVKKESTSCKRLKNLSDELGGEIYIEECDGETSQEALIAMVSEGKIQYTVCDESTAKIQSMYYSNIDMKTALSFEQRIAWAVNENNPELLKKMNQWINRIKKNGTFNTIYYKYFTQNRKVTERVRCLRTSMCGKSISPYDEIIVSYADKMGWDWRLLASVIYQESQFNPSAKSWAGACGLMQLMPKTAECFGAQNLEDPVESIKAGTKYLQWLENYWKKKVKDPKERMKFVLASYNVGQEHVADAQRLAAKYNKNPEIWDNNVAYFILMKSNEKYCKDPVVKYGYCRGKEPFEYVKNILERYEHYQKLIKQEV